jgi:uncharacterized membrane protein YuzA (DUF378 family)
MSQKLSGLDWVAMVLMIVGSINWGLVGLFGFDLVFTIFGEGVITTIVYVLVGLSGVYALAVVGKLEKKA